MKNFLNLFLILTQVILVTHARASLTEPDKQIISHFNELKNGGFENGKAGLSATTCALSIDTANHQGGSQSGLMTCTSQVGDLQYNVTPTAQYQSMNMYATCKVKTSSSTIQFCGMANGVETSCVAVPGTGAWTIPSINFNGPTNGQTIGYKVKNTSASGTITYNIDDCDVGAGTITAVNQPVDFGSAKWTGTTSCSWTRTTTDSLADFSADSDCTLPAGSNLTGNATAPATKIPATTLINMGSGTYELYATGLFVQDQSRACTWGFSDGTTFVSSGVTQSPAAAGVTGGMSLLGRFNYAVAPSTKTFSIQGTGNGISSVCTLNNTRTPYEDLRIVVKYYPDASSNVINPNITPGSWSGYHTASAPWSTTSTAAPADVSNATGIALTQTSARNITCVTASGSLPAITCNLPRTGRYGVTAVVSGYGTVANNAMRVQLADGSNNIIVRPKTNNSAANTSQTTAVLDGIYDATATGNSTFKVQLSNGGTGGTVQIAPGASGDSSIEWKVIELDAAMPSPILAAMESAEVYVSGTPTLGTLPTKIYSYPTTTTNSGTALTYARDTVNGDTITVNKKGVYGISVQGAGGSNQQGVSVSASSLTTSITALTIAQGSRYHPGSNNGANGSIVLLLNVGDVIRAHSDAGGTIGTGVYASFHVVLITPVQ